LTAFVSSTYFQVFVFIFGACFGSFLNVCIYRIPIDKSVVKPSSFCPKCGKPINFYDNIPILSYIILGGRCRNCNESFSFRYPFVELISALFTLIIFKIWGLSLIALFFWLFTLSLIVITFIDIDHQIIPDVISLPGIAVGFISSFFTNIGWLNSLLGIVIGGGSLFLIAYLYEKLAGKEGMGGGDIKLLGMIGAFLGAKSLLFVILISSLLGSVVGIGYMVFKKKDSKFAIPFGPFLSIGALAYLYYGNEIVKWYINFVRLN